MRLMALLMVCGLCVTACSTSDDGNKSADAASEAAAPNCDSFTKVGDSCAVDSTVVCFRQCRVDGCSCKNGAWTCTRDFSCMPQDASTDDVSVEDAALVDATADAPVDGSHDATSDGSSDAPSDGANDAAGDAANDAPGDAGTDG